MSQSHLLDQDQGWYGYFSSDRDQQFQTCTPVRLFFVFVFFLCQSTICGRTQTFASRYICGMTILRGGYKRASLNITHLIQYIITEKVIEFIALDNQLISMVEDQSFWIPGLPYDIGLTLYWFNFGVTTCGYGHQFYWCQTAVYVKQATEEMLNACEIEKQWADDILRE